MTRRSPNLRPGVLTLLALALLMTWDALGGAGRAGAFDAEYLDELHFNTL